MRDPQAVELRAAVPDTSDLQLAQPHPAGLEQAPAEAGGPRTTSAPRWDLPETAGFGPGTRDAPVGQDRPSDALT